MEMYCFPRAVRFPDRPKNKTCLNAPVYPSMCFSSIKGTTIEASSLFEGNRKGLIKRKESNEIYIQ